MGSYFSSVVTEEVFAAWLDGTLTDAQEARFLEVCSLDEALQEILEANDQIEEDYESMVEVGFVLPDEFNSDFTIPYVGVDEYADDGINSYEPIEPYEQDDEDEDDNSVSEQNDIEGTDFVDTDSDGLMDGLLML